MAIAMIPMVMQLGVVNIFIASICLTTCSKSDKPTVPIANQPSAAFSQISAMVKDGQFTIYAARNGKRSEIVKRTPEDAGDEHTASVAEVKGSGGRIFFAQMFVSQGADEFWRDISAWVIDAASDQVLWQGEGRFANSFDSCDRITDVPEVEMDGTSVVVRLRNETIAYELQVEMECEDSAPVLREVFRRRL
jgi:hypothetical protein